MSDNNPTPAPAKLADDELARLDELASKAKAATLGGHWAPDVGVNEWNPIGDFIKACSPDVYAALISELRTLRDREARLKAFVRPWPTAADQQGSSEAQPETLHDAIAKCGRGDDRDRLAGELADLRRMYDLAVADAARMSKRIDAEDGEVERLGRGDDAGEGLIRVLRKARHYTQHYVEHVDADCLSDLEEIDATLAAVAPAPGTNPCHAPAPAAPATIVRPTTASVSPAS